MGAQNYNNPYNRGLSHAFEFHFPATVTHGVFHGERGTRGEQAFYELNGIIQPDGTPCYRRAVLPENKSTARNSFHRVPLIRTR
jgi:hypothetical protein